MEIRVYNRDQGLIGILDAVDSLIWTDKFDEPGDFEILISITDQALEVLQETNYIEIPYSDRTMVIEYVEVKTDIEEGDKLLVKGRSLESLMELRVLWKQTLIDDQLEDAFVYICKFNDNFIYYELDLNENPNTPWMFHIPEFSFTLSGDPDIEAINWESQFWGETYLKIVSDVAVKNNIGFKVIRTNENKFDLSFYKGIDRSYLQTINPWVVFSPEFDNLLSSSFIRTTWGYRNYGTALYKNEYQDINGYTFLLDTFSDMASDDLWDADLEGLDVRHVFIDAMDIRRDDWNEVDPENRTQNILAFNAQIYNRIYEELAKQKRVNLFDGEADTTNSFQYGTDFFLGDIVQIEDKFGNAGQSKISSVTITEDISGFKVLPSFEPI